MGREQIKINQKKLVLLALAVLLICILMVCGVIYVRNGVVQQVNLNGVAIDNQLLTYEFAEAEVKNDTLHIQGWAIIVGEDTGFFDMEILLKQKENGQYTAVNTDFRQNSNLTAAMKDGHDYDNSGFRASVLTDRLASGEYQICILYRCNGRKILCETQEKVQIGLQSYQNPL